MSTGPSVGADRLALDGGTPVRTSFLPYAHQQIDDDDVAAVVAALRSDWLTTGPRVRQFEEGLEAVTGRPARRRLLVGDRGAPRRDGRGRARSWRRGADDADDVRRDRERRSCTSAPNHASPTSTPTRC